MIEMITIIGAALGLGLLISSVYMFTHRKEVYSQSFTLSLIILPAIIAMIIVVVDNNVASAFSMAGAFSLIRFRSTPGDSKDITYVFFTLGVGLTCGMGLVGYALLFTVMICLAMLVLTQVKFGVAKKVPLRLKVTMPEDLEYYGILDDILTSYTTTYKLVRVKTAEFGALFEVSYDITMEDIAQSKAMIDQIRARNGNLKVMLLTGEHSQNGLL